MRFTFFVAIFVLILSKYSIKDEVEEKIKKETPAKVARSSKPRGEKTPRTALYPGAKSKDIYAPSSSSVITAEVVNLSKGHTSSSSSSNPTGVSSQTPYPKLMYNGEMRSKAEVEEFFREAEAEVHECLLSNQHFQGDSKSTKLSFVDFSFT